MNLIASEPSGLKFRKFLIFTLVAATVAASATWISSMLRFEVWMMFAGFIAWFTRPTSTREGLSAILCLWLGVGLAAISFIPATALIPVIGAMALPLIVFIITIVVVGLRSTKIVDNMLAWFLGMITFFAAERGISAEAFAQIAGATALGGSAGWTIHLLNKRLQLH